MGEDTCTHISCPVVLCCAVLCFRRVCGGSFGHTHIPLNPFPLPYHLPYKRTNNNTNDDDDDDDVTTTEDRDPRVGVLFILLSCLVQGTQYVFEEKVMAVDGLPPMWLIGLEVSGLMNE